MGRMSLDTVVLSLKQMMKEEVRPILAECLEPPDTTNIDQAFSSLHRSGFITSSDDEICQITELGDLANSLGIDLQFGSLIGLGIQFGVAAEAIEAAAALSLSKQPWIITNPLFHEVREFNRLCSRTFVSRSKYDGGLFSEPLALSNLLWAYRAAAKDRNGFCRANHLSRPRMGQLAVLAASIRERVAKVTGLPPAALEAAASPSETDFAKVTVLRILMVWCFPECIIRSQRSVRVPKAGGIVVPVIGSGGGDLEKAHLDTVLQDRHAFVLSSNSYTFHRGSCDPMPIYLDQFESRFLSLSIESGVGIFWLTMRIGKEVLLQVYADHDLAKEMNLYGLLPNNAQETALVERAPKNEGGRKCSEWCIAESVDTNSIEISKFTVVGSSKCEKYSQMLKNNFESAPSCSRALSCSVTQQGAKKARRIKFALCSMGESAIYSERDIQHLFLAPEIEMRVEERKLGQSIRFALGEAKLDGGSQPPLIVDIPEGLRVLTTLAASRYRDKFVRFESTEEKRHRLNNDPALYPQPFNVPPERPTGIPGGACAPVGTVDIKLPRDMLQTWKVLGEGGNCLVESNNVVAGAVPTWDDGRDGVYCVACNTLLLRGGSVRAEGLTMLPGGLPFLQTAFASFGLDFPGAEPNDWRIRERVASAEEFGRSCQDLGENLMCYPDRVRELCALFDGLVEQPLTAWADLDRNPYVLGNMPPKRTSYGGNNRPKTVYPDSKQYVPVRIKSTLSVEAKPWNFGTAGRALVPCPPSPPAVPSLQPSGDIEVPFRCVVLSPSHGILEFIKLLFYITTLSDSCRVLVLLPNESAVSFFYYVLSKLLDFPIFQHLRDILDIHAKTKDFSAFRECQKGILLTDLCYYDNAEDFSHVIKWGPKELLDIACGSNSKYLGNESKRLWVLSHFESAIIGRQESKGKHSFAVDEHLSHVLKTQISDFSTRYERVEKMVKNGSQNKVLKKMFEDILRTYIVKKEKLSTKEQVVAEVNKFLKPTGWQGLSSVSDSFLNELELNGVCGLTKKQKNVVIFDTKELDKLALEHTWERNKKRRSKKRCDVAVYYRDGYRLSFNLLNGNIVSRLNDSTEDADELVHRGMTICDAVKLFLNPAQLVEDGPNTKQYREDRPVSNEKKTKKKKQKKQTKEKMEKQRDMKIKRQQKIQEEPIFEW